MVVGNDVVTDNRVKKEAVALAEAGLRVTVVGYSPGGERTESELGPVRLVRVPVRWDVRDRIRRRNVTRRRFPIRIGYDTARDQLAARARVMARRDEVSSRTGDGPLRKGRLGLLRGQAALVKLRGGVQRRLDSRVAAAVDRLDARKHPVEDGPPWRRYAPEMLDWERELGPVLDALEADVIHAHDFHMVALAQHAVDRARRRGRTVRWVYDAHEWVVGLPLYYNRTAQMVAAWGNLEAEFAARADAVVTVSEPIADALVQRLGLGRRPAVVLNIPVLSTNSAAAPSLRQAAGVGDDVPLLVYSGGITPARGIATLVEALGELSGVHLAVVAVPATGTPYLDDVLAAATLAGTRDRVHVVPPVGVADVVGYLSQASLGVHPLVHVAGHEMALPNKLFEYLHAGLPVVVSDVRLMADFVQEHGVGRVFTAEDPAALAAAVRAVLAERDTYVAAIRGQPELRERYSWERQAEVLLGVYRDLLGDQVHAPDGPLDPAALEERRFSGPS